MPKHGTAYSRCKHNKRQRQAPSSTSSLTRVVLIRVWVSCLPKAARVRSSCWETARRLALKQPNTTTASTAAQTFAPELEAWEQEAETAVPLDETSRGRPSRFTRAQQIWIHMNRLTAHVSCDSVPKSCVENWHPTGTRGNILPPTCTVQQVRWVARSGADS